MSPALTMKLPSSASTAPPKSIRVMMSLRHLARSAGVMGLTSPLLARQAWRRLALVARVGVTRVLDCVEDLGVGRSIDGEQADGTLGHPAKAVIDQRVVAGVV